MTHLKTAFISQLLLLTLASSAYAHKTNSISEIRKESQELDTQTKAEELKALQRWNHAKELLGKRYKKSVVRTGEAVAELDSSIYQWTERALKSRWKKFTRTISKTIIEQSTKYGFDPVFLMAVIENESSFNPEIVGSAGEIGLMQITPQTAEWISKKYDLPWKGARSLKNPATNIRIGAAYMAYLREQFENRSQLYLAAYNMGSSNVKRALGRQIWPREYSSRVMHYYVKYYAELKEEIGKVYN